MIDFRRDSYGRGSGTALRRGAQRKGTHDTDYCLLHTPPCTEHRREAGRSGRDSIESDARYSHLLIHPLSAPAESLYRIAPRAGRRSER